MQQAEDFIEQHVCEAIKVGDICRAAGVSERTLEYAFVEQFGIGPNQYLKALRLVLVRRSLRIADAQETKVVDIANSFGFWHLGQFAADYRQRFNELPSDTIKRAAPGED